MRYSSLQIVHSWTEKGVSIFRVASQKPLLVVAQLTLDTITVCFFKVFLVDLGRGHDLAGIEENKKRAFSCHVNDQSVGDNDSIVNIKTYMKSLLAL